MEEVYIDEGDFRGNDTRYITGRGLGEEAAKSVLKEIINTETTIQNIDMSLKGYAIEANEKGEFVWVQRTKPFVSDDLRVLIINVLRAHLTPSVQFSNIRDEVISAVCMQLHEDLATLFFFNDTEIRSNESEAESDSLARASLIIDMIMHQIWITLHQPLGAGQRDMLGKMGSWSESFQPPDKKRKILPI